MRKTLSIVLCLAMIVPTATVVQAESEDSLREQNRAFILEQWGDDWEHDDPVDVTVNGEHYEMTAADALDFALDAHERVNLRAIANGGSHSGEPYAGDLLMENFEKGVCFDQPFQATPIPRLNVEPQMMIHRGGLVEGTVPEDTMIYDRTVKVPVGSGAAGATYFGNGHVVCFDGRSISQSWVFFNGVIA